MKVYKICSVLILLIVFSITVKAQEKELPPEGGEPKNFQIPERKVLELDNGMKVVMVDYGIVPKVQLQLIINTGAINEEENEQGITNLLSNLLEEGTQSYGAKELSMAFAKMGGQLGISAGMHNMGLGTTVLSEFTPRAIELIAEVVQKPLLPESELERLKNNYKRQLSVSRSQPQTIANQEFQKAIYGDHPYGRELPSDELIDGHTISSIKAFFEEEIGAKRSTLYLVGKFNENEVREAVKANFGGWKAGKEKEYIPAEPNMDVDIQLDDRPNSPQATLRFGIPVPDPSHPDYVALEVMDDLLGGSFSSRITSNIREDKGYTYSPFSTVTSNTYKSAIWYQAADVTIESTKGAMLEISREIDRLRNEAPTDEELNGIKNYMAGIFVLQNSSRGGIIGQLNQIDFHGLGEDYLNKRVQSIYDVSPEKVKEVASKYLDPEKMFLMVVGDVKTTEPQIQEWKKADKKFKKVID
jgi:predicted Zn-dependent peptidase